MDVYVTVKQSPRYVQMTLEEFLFQTDYNPYIPDSNNITNTRTYRTKNVNENLLKMYDIPKLISKLKQFNEQTECLREKDRDTLYSSFKIPKKSGGFRVIDEPSSELMDALRRLKTIFEVDFNALYHTSAFAYIKHRSTIDAVKRHQQNESKWFGKYDLSNFFGSTTLDYAMKMISMVFPFSAVAMSPNGKKELKKALELAFLNGGLPQGTPISPLITNIMMIPVDYTLAKSLRNFNNQRFIYTRYADDFIISSKYSFKFRDIENLIINTLNEFGAPFSINSKKTRYGSASGSNWNLGVMLNKDNQITIGYKKKRQFQAMITSYLMDKQNNHPWSVSDIQTLEGYRNYYRMIEKETIDKIINHIGKKFHVDVVKSIKKDLKP